ncbi:MAG: histidine phosphatase family protein [Oscillospiraceae bacterium]|nr:histidine phosphatase family protein [Oscillospiraceae bacterium]MCR5306772.1 histidine phosphatase family protein [Oscillospiraceae bacterium]
MSNVLTRMHEIWYADDFPSLASRYTKIYFIRNAATEASEYEIVQGAGYSSPISSKGQEQLKLLAKRFQNVPLSAIYYSGNASSTPTAMAVNKHHHVPMRPDPALEEINFGAAKGQTYSWFRAFFPENFSRMLHEPHRFEAPLGDSTVQIYLRMRDAIRKIEYANRGQTIAVVSHQWALRCMMCWLYYDNLKMLRYITWADNTAISLGLYDTDRDLWRIRFRNDDSHLPDAFKSYTVQRWNIFDC